MSKITATNNAVWVIRDETPKESGGMILPESGRTKPHIGTIISVGDLVTDKNIKKGEGKKCLWHPTTGQEIEFENIVYVVLPSEHILSIV